MERQVREVKKEAQALVASGEIEDFSFDHDKRHHRLNFRVKGKWMSVPFSSSARSAYVNNFTRQQVRRMIRAMP
jgi:hypothetical protein